MHAAEVMASDTAPAWSEESFRSRVDALAPHAAGTAELIELLQESHPAYHGRSSAATVRMRAWLLSALSRHGLSDAALLFVLEELDTARSPCLVASAARALRSAPNRSCAMAPFLLQALSNIRDIDDYVDLNCYGGVGGVDASGTAFTELLVSLRWLGAHAAGVLGDLDMLATTNDRPLSRDQHDEMARTMVSIREQASDATASACCSLPLEWGAFRRWLRGGAAPVETIEFEDQDGDRVSFREFFADRPAIVVFFYTRCDNAQKCSLTVSKLAQVQRLLTQAGMRDRIRTAAITYDPKFDLAARLRGYAQSRGVITDTNHRVLRAVTGMDVVHAHFRLGVNFIESLVNRHRIEAYVVDEEGRIAASFERIRWDERQVVAEAITLLDRSPRHSNTPALPSDEAQTKPARVAPIDLLRCRESGRASIGPALSVAVALFPKCPLCGATYLSMSGIAAMPQLPGYYWFFPVLAIMMVINLGSLGLQARARRRWAGFGLAVAGTAIILIVSAVRGLEAAMPVGVALTAAGSLLSVFLTRSRTAIGKPEGTGQASQGG